MAFFVGGNDRFAEFDGGANALDGFIGAAHQFHDNIGMLMIYRLLPIGCEKFGVVFG